MTTDTHDSARLAAIAVAGLLVLTVAVGLGLRLVFAGDVYPGVTADGIDVGGLPRAEAEAAIAEATAPLTQTVTLVHPSDSGAWSFTANELGLSPDPEASVEAAMAAGRRGGPVEWLLGPLGTWVAQPTVPLRLTLDSARGVEGLAPVIEAVTVPPQNARLERVDGELRAVDPVLGQALDPQETLEAARRALEDTPPGKPVSATLQIIETSPRVATLQDVVTGLDLATSAPVTVTFQGDLVGTLGPETLGDWFVVEDRTTPEGDTVPTLVVDRDAIAAWLDERVTNMGVEARSPRFAIDPGTREAWVLRPGRPEIEVDLPPSVDRIIEAALSERRSVELAADVGFPNLGPNVRSRLNFALDAGRSYTSLAGQPEGRIANIRRAVEVLNGVAVAPNTEFSLLDALGPATDEAGYVTAFFETEGGLEGGLTQVATTIFRAALWAGLPVTERHPHPHRIGWLEPPVGLDATVSPPGLDLKIYNDTQSYLLFELAVEPEPEALRVLILAAPELERDARFEGPEVTAVTPPGGTETRVVPGIPVGTRVQIGWAREGATADVIRIVTQDGQEILRDRFVSQYAPAPDVFVVGAGP